MKDKTTVPKTMPPAEVKEQCARNTTVRDPKRRTAEPAKSSAQRSREVILERRQRFIVAALTGAGLANAACSDLPGQARTCLSFAPPIPVPSHGPPQVCLTMVPDPPQVCLTMVPDPIPTVPQPVPPDPVLDAGPGPSGNPEPDAGSDPQTSDAGQDAGKAPLEDASDAPLEDAGKVPLKDSGTQPATDSGKLTP